MMATFGSQTNGFVATYFFMHSWCYCMACW